MMPPVLANTLKPGFVPERLASDIWSVLPITVRSAPYDPIARAYDRFIGNTLYNKLVWGNWSSIYRDAARDALRDAPDGPILDCGCGSLIFTQQPYRTAPLDRTLLFDRSLGMMRRGAKRLPGATFLQGDALALPFADDTFALTLSWGLAHLFGCAPPLFVELSRVTKPGGRVRLSMLVLADRFPGDQVLLQLHRRGEIALPEQTEAAKAAFAEHFMIESAMVKGNMLFLNGRA